MSRAWPWERGCDDRRSLGNTVPGTGHACVQAGTGTCLAALSHEGLQAHTGEVINQIDTVPTVQARAGLALVHLCKGRPGRGGSGHAQVMPVPPLPPSQDDAWEEEDNSQEKTKQNNKQNKQNQCHRQHQVLLSQKGGWGRSRAGRQLGKT